MRLTMKLLLLIICLLFFQKFAVAQPCTDETIHSMPGQWKMLGPVRGTDQTAADQAKEQAILKDMFQTIRTRFKWELSGGQAEYNYSITTNLQSFLPLYLNKTVNTGKFVILFRDFLCVRGEKMVNEPSGWLYVYYNQLPFPYDNTFYSPGPGGFDADDPETDVYILSSVLPEFTNGVWHFFGGFKNGVTILQ